MEKSLLAAAFFVTGRVPIGNRTALVVELPVANGSFTASSLGFGGTESGTTVGNPYVGIEGGQDGASVFGEFGVRPPLVSESKGAARIVGSFSDLDRADAFLPNAFTASAFVNYRTAAREGFRVRIRGGALVWVETKPQLPGHAEVFEVYAMQAGYASRSFEVLGGLTGRRLVTDCTGSCFLDQFVVSAHLNLGRVEPGVSLRVPLDNGRNDVAGSVIGVSVRMALK